jgi:hypothetical protein
MENITNIIRPQSYDDNITKLKLSEKYTLYKTKYDGRFEKESFKKRIEENKNLYFYDSDKMSNSLLFYIECIEFNHVDEYVLDIFKKILDKEINVYSKSSWIYTQIQSFDMNWMHTHENLFSSNKTNLKTEYTFVFYIQIPKNLKDGEGDIVFKTEDNKLFNYSPEENDILIFPGEIEHMAVPTKSSNEDRLVYANNISFNLDKFVENKKPIRFKNYIYSKIFNKNQDTRI